MLGKPVTHALIQGGHDVTILARDTNKASRIFEGATIVEGDVFNLASLEKAMKGIDVVYINLSVLQNSRESDSQPEREGVENILKAAVKEGIKRIYYLSSLIQNYQGMNGFDWWAFRVKQGAVKKIKSSGIPYTIFYPSTFMETFPFQMIRGNKIMMLGTSKAPMWFIAAEDFSRQVLKAFGNHSSLNHEYPIQGLKPYTFDEAADVIINNYKKQRLNVMKAPIGMVKLLSRFLPRLSYGLHICEALNKYPEKFQSQQSWQELGKPAISLEDFAARMP